jgi:two-component system, chemotaxis family, sensor kinase CheA
MARLLGPPLVERAQDDPMPVMVLNAGSGRLAVVVDRLMSEEELVVRPLPRGHAVSPHVAGAAVLPTGGVAVVLNVSSLVAAGHVAGASAAPRLGVPTSAPAQRQRILVADDSITTRILEQSVLEAAGFDVRTAVDGVDAWRRLEEDGCDLVVTDVEMPRMDGFALCQAIRGSRRYAQLPVVIVSALESPENRARGLEAGADAYIVKSAFDQQSLLDLVRQLLA